VLQSLSRSNLTRLQITPEVMHTNPVSNDPKADLSRIYQYGCDENSQQQAVNYFYAFFSMFEKLAANPYFYQSVEHIRKGYRRAVCCSDSIY
ncbi:type II toxin-antitoxin system RelE/ParE family toxin, partial [Pseudoalteromonas sp. S558]|uniref:type II toxin-antitoxin system RelE/ParE family toxin n=1 Tax=Pseudoalteromonas sp. S558 TaxID=2066515 RepID=UPI001BB25362